MGISGLYTLLKSIQKPCHIQTFAGKTVAIDGYAWLHRAAMACATQLALGHPTNIYVKSIMNRVRMLSHFGVTPYFVFDGDYLPSKAGTETDRSKQRENARRMGSELLAMGKAKQAHQALNAAVDITPEMAAAVIHELRRNNIAYIVAPYEADSQLAYLERQGLVDAVLAEDSDLLVFGVKCLITKLDQYGSCVVFERKSFAACRGASLAGWTDKDFRHMAILSGCDYLPNLKSIGLNRAHALLRRHKTVERVLQNLRFEGKVTVPSDYLTKFKQADQTFLHQWVFCPLKQELVHLNPLESPMTFEDMPFLGEYRKPKIAAGVARGELHPHTREKLIPYPSDRQAAQRGFQSAQSYESIKTKAIETFFQTKQSARIEEDSLKKRPLKTTTPSRMPLAELDVNSFILPAKQGHPQPLTTLQATPQRIPSDENASPAFTPSTTAQSRSTPRYPRRLCQDDAQTAANGLTSKFFSAPKQKKRKASATFEIHSDDSVAEAFWALTSPNKTSINTLPEKDSIPTDPGIEDAEATFIGDSEVEDFGQDATLVEEDVPVIRAGFFEQFTLEGTLKNANTKISSSRKRKASQSPRVSISSALPVVDFDSISQSAWEIAEELVVAEASDDLQPVPLPITTPANVLLSCGSEDLLVPESDGEEDVPVKRGLDLTRFAYDKTSV